MPKANAVSSARVCERGPPVAIGAVMSVVVEVAAGDRPSPAKESRSAVAVAVDGVVGVDEAGSVSPGLEADVEAAALVTWGRRETGIRTNTREAVSLAASRRWLSEVIWPQ